MNDRTFDEKIKSLMDSHSCEVDDSVWTNIEAGLLRRRRIKLYRRVGYYSAAAAAAVILGLFLILNPFDSSTSTIESVASVSTVQPEATTAPASTSETSTSSSETSTSLSETLVSPSETSPSRSNLVSSTSTTITHSTSPISSSSSISTIPSDSSTIIASVTKTSSLENTESTSSAKATSLSQDVEEKTKETQYKTISQQIAERGDSYIAQETVKKSNDMIVSLSSDLSTLLSSGRIDFSSPSFSSGKGANANYGITPISEPRHFFPVTVGLELHYPFLKDRMSVGIGVNYTYLYSRYEALIDKTFQGNIEQSIHYIGIPVDLIYNIIRTDHLLFYANIGGMMEKGIKASYQISNLNNVETTRSESIPSVQWSVNVGIGFEYRFIKAMGLFIDPRCTYFFDCGQPYSIRSEQPFQFNLQLGFRFHL